MKSKSEINEEKLRQISEVINDPYQRQKLYVNMWFPMGRDRYLYKTEEEYVEAKCKQLGAEAEISDRERDKR